MIMGAMGSNDMEAAICTNQEGGLISDPSRNNVSTNKLGFVYSLREIWTSGR
jgi:hypothetical protein